jgi:2-desacetyl-2-hydroxyethyl bacteriochlorophyllide A dehydrogenase
MRAAVLHSPRRLRVEAVPEPDLASDDVLVRVAAIGLCGTDYRIWSGDRPVRYPRVMGHEIVGRAVATGPAADQVTAGQRIAVEPNYSCRVCLLCREGNRNLCLGRVAIGIDVDGGFAEMVKVPARCCWPAPDSVEDARLVLAEPLAVVVRAVARARPATGECGAVLGLGSLGLLALQVLKARGLRVLAVGRTDRRLDLARTLGADAVATTAGREHGRTARAFSGREGVDVVIETAGTAEAVEHAVDLARPGGRVVLTGLPHEPSSLSFFPVVRREITLTGSMIYQDEFPEAIRLLVTGAVRPEPLLTHRFPLDEIDEAFHAHRTPEAIKVAIFT